MALLDVVRLFEIAAAQTPIFTVDWHLPKGQPGEWPLPKDTIAYLADTYGENALEITQSQFDILRPCRKLANDYGWAVLTRTPNRIKKIFNKPISAMILSDPAITQEAILWEQMDYSSDERISKLRHTDSYSNLYNAIAALVDEVQRGGGVAVIEPK